MLSRPLIKVVNESGSLESVETNETYDEILSLVNVKYKNIKHPVRADATIDMIRVMRRNDPDFNAAGPIKLLFGFDITDPKNQKLLDKTLDKTRQDVLNYYKSLGA